MGGAGTGTGTWADGRILRSANILAKAERNSSATNRHNLPCRMWCQVIDEPQPFPPVALEAGGRPPRFRRKVTYSVLYRPARCSGHFSMCSVTLAFKIYRRTFKRLGIGCYASRRCCRMPRPRLCRDPALLETTSRGHCRTDTRPHIFPPLRARLPIRCLPLLPREMIRLLKS